MKILVQAKSMKVTQGIHNFVKQKVARKISKLGQKVIGVKVYLEDITRKKSDPNGSQAKVKIEIPGKDIIVSEKSHDPYQAISNAIKAGARQLRKIKEKKFAKTRSSRK